MLSAYEPEYNHTLPPQVVDVLTGGKGFTCEKITYEIDGWGEVFGYEINHFSFDVMLPPALKEWDNRADWAEESTPCYPKLLNYKGESFPNGGVCDDLAQIFEQCPEIVRDEERKFIISLTPIVRADQSPQGGWRWHKWGDYIGNHSPKYEYLYEFL